MLPSSTASTYGFALVDTPPTTPIPTLSVRVFEPSSSEANMVPYLAAIHANCITADHTIMSFLPPIDQEKLLQLWRDVIAEVRARQRLMVLLFDESPGQQPPASLMGVATLKTPESETGPFRGWVKNVLVSPRFRRRGGGRALMGKVEEEAAKRGRNLLVRRHPSSSEVLFLFSALFASSLAYST